MRVVEISCDMLNKGNQKGNGHCDSFVFFVPSNKQSAEQHVNHRVQWENSDDSLKGHTDPIEIFLE